jgi:hypothetical protein
MIKILFLCALSMAVISPCYAEDFPDMARTQITSALSTGGKVIVIFHTDKSLAATTAVISAAMKVSDPDAVLFKHWVTDITFRGYDENRKCGMVVGSWWSPDSSSMATEWEEKVYPKVKDLVNTVTFQYVKDGGIVTKENTPGSNGEDVMELCLN